MVPGMHSKSGAGKGAARFRLRFEHALLISFVFHGLILSIKFAVPDMGMPGSQLGKKVSRVEPVALSVKLVTPAREVTPPSVKALPVWNAQKVLAVQAPVVATGLAVAALVMPGKTVPLPASVPDSVPKPVKPVTRRRNQEPVKKKNFEPEPTPRTPATMAQVSELVDVAPPHAETSVLTTPAHAPDIELAMPPVAVQSKPTAQELQREEELRQEAQRAEDVMQAAAQQAAERAKAAAQLAAQQAAAEREAQRQEAQRAEAAAQLAAQQDASEREAQRQEAQRAEAAAQVAAQQAASGREAQRQEGLRAEAAARQAAAEREVQRQEAQRQLATRQDAQRKAEAAPAARSPERPPMESAKQRSLIGRAEQDQRLRMMAEGWRQKIEQNAPFDVFKAAKSGGAYENPVVTVSLQRDGSLESIVIDRSSGVATIDNAVRRVVMMLSPFAPFSSEVAMEYDIVEIRRVWTFDTAVRLLYGGR